jgi:hypothetical protein
VGLLELFRNELQVGSKSLGKLAARNGRNAGVISLFKCGVKNSRYWPWQQEHLR